MKKFLLSIAISLITLVSFAGGPHGGGHGGGGHWGGGYVGGRYDHRGYSLGYQPRHYTDGYGYYNPGYYYEPVYSTVWVGERYINTPYGYEFIPGHYIKIRIR